MMKPPLNAVHSPTVPVLRKVGVSGGHGVRRTAFWPLPTAAMGLAWPPSRDA
jgi:hypothetical protein